MKNHKYVARVNLPKSSGKRKNNYLYFYTMAEYQAYLRGKNKVFNSSNSNTSNVISTILTSPKRASKTSVTTGERLYSEILSNKSTKKKEKEKSIDKKAKDYINKYIKKNANKKVSDLKESTEKGKETVSKLLKNISSGVTNATNKISNIVNKVTKKDSIDDMWKQVMDEKKQNVPKSEKKEPEYETIKASSISELPKKSKEYTDDEDQAAVNPNYLKGREYKVNCQYCSTAYEFRKRGYDVEAAPFITGEDDEPTVNEIASWYKDPERGAMRNLKDRREKSIKDKISEMLGTYVDDRTEAIEYKEDLVAQFKEYGEGARGNLFVAWKTGSGHSLVWEVKNGEVIIRDCQTNKVEDIDGVLEISKTFSYIRTDNAEFTDEALKTVRYKRKVEK